MGEHTQYYHQLDPAEAFVVNLSVAFLACGLVVIIVLFIARVWKSARKTRSQTYQAKVRVILNDLVVSKSLSQAHNPESAIDYKIAELNNFQQTSFCRQILLDQIIDMKRNLSGSSVKTLKMLYTRLEIYSGSLQKLNSLSPIRKARGIRELSAMEYKEAHHNVTRYLTARNRTLREEAIIASLELSPQDPLSFLTNYKYDITLWMRIQLHRYLQKMDPRTIPDFSLWFHHPNPTVVLFSISMVRAFRQTKSIPGLIKLLENDNERVLCLTIEAITALEAFECADTLRNIAQTHFKNKKISRRIANCVGGIGTAEKHATVLFQYTEHPNYEVRFTALKSLTRLGVSHDHILSKCETRQEEVGSILQHLSDPLLRH